MSGKLTAITAILFLTFAIPLFAQEAQPLAETQAAPSADFDVAMKHYRQGHYSRAAEEFQKVVEADPKNAAAWYFLGYAHYVLRHYPEALTAFKKCFEADPKFDPRPYWQRR
jgi:TolA-binding protein